MKFRAGVWQTARSPYRAGDRGSERPPPPSGGRTNRSFLPQTNVAQVSFDAGFGVLTPSVQIALAIQILILTWGLVCSRNKHLSNSLRGGVCVPDLSLQRKDVDMGPFRESRQVTVAIEARTTAERQ